jgi:hypothetical protein
MEEELKMKEMKIMMKNISLWIGLNKCGSFKTEFLVSILEKYEEYDTLTDSQFNCVKNIYDKCHIKSKMKNLQEIPYRANYIKNLVIEDEIKCENCKCDLDEWVFEPYSDKYTDLYCSACFDTLFNKTTTETKEKRVYKPRTKKVVETKDVETKTETKTETETETKAESNKENKT